MRSVLFGSFGALALAGAMATPGCKGTPPVSPAPVAVESTPEPIVTLDALFADCFVDDDGTAGGGLVGDCGASVDNKHAGFTDIEYASADEPVRQEELARMALDAGATVEETTIEWAGNRWPALRITHKDRRHSKDEATVLEVPGNSGIRALSCRDPWGRCKTILLRALSGEYRRTAKRPAAPPTSPSPARRELKAFFRRCKRLGAPSNKLFVVSCPDEDVRIVSAQWIRISSASKSTQDTMDRLTQRAPKEATQTKLQIGDKSWPMWFTKKTEKIVEVMEVSVRTDSRTILQVACTGPHLLCLDMVKKIIAEPPPYAGLWAGADKSPKD